MKRNSIAETLREYFRKFDKTLLIFTVICSAVSVLLLYSLSQNKTIAPRYYRVQLISSCIGIAVCFILSAVDYKKLAKLWFLYAPITLILMFLTFTSLGIGVDGADDVAWLNLGFITIQPSELLKIVFIITFSYHLSEVSENMNRLPHMFLLCLHGAVPAAIVAKQGDYGTAVIFAGIFLVMLFCAGISFKYIIAVLAVLPPAGWFIWNYGLNSDHKNRILVLFNPGSDPLGTEYQQNLGLKSLAEGGILGKGLFDTESSSVPEIYNDFIFSYLGETMGFAGCIIMIAVLVYICLKIISDSRKAKDSLGKNICVGVFAMLFAHCFMNIGMVLKVMPVIGIPLPFLSAGGTAVISMYTAIGLVMSVYSHSEEKYRMFSRRSEEYERFKDL